jgi:hypothetical protein
MTEISKSLEHLNLILVLFCIQFRAWILKYAGRTDFHIHSNIAGPRVKMSGVSAVGKKRDCPP